MRRADVKGTERDALRRRLYGPGSTSDDVERYRRASGRRGTEQQAPGPRHRRPIGLLIAAGVVVVALLAGGLWLAARRPATTAGPTAAPSRTVVAAPPPVQQQQLTVSAADRDAFVRTLATTTGADPLSSYLYTHPDSRPDEVRTVQRAESEEHRGEGPSAVRLDPSRSAQRGGRATVVLVVDHTVQAAWRAAGASGAIDVARSVRPIAGIPVTSTFRYSGPAPTRLTVTVPAGVHWSAFVAFTD